MLLAEMTTSNLPMAFWSVDFYPQMRDFDNRDEYYDYEHNDHQIMLTMASSEEEARKRFEECIQSGTYTITTCQSGNCLPGGFISTQR